MNLTFSSVSFETFTDGLLAYGIVQQRSGRVLNQIQGQPLLRNFATRTVRCIETACEPVQYAAEDTSKKEVMTLFICQY